MADPEDDGRVSKEAHQRMVTERDEWKAKAEQLSATVTDLGTARKLEELLGGKVADPRGTAEFLLPHVRDVEIDKLADHIESDAFKARLALFAPVAAPTPPADPPTPPADPGPGFAGPGPSPGGQGQAPSGATSIRRDSPEYQRALAQGDHEQIQKWHDDGLVAAPTKPY